MPCRRFWQTRIYGSASHSRGEGKAVALIFLVVVFWVIPIWICVDLGNKKNRSGAGWACGIILGWLGVVIMAILDPRPSA